MSALGDGEGGTAAAGGALAATLRPTRNDAMVATHSNGCRTALARSFIAHPFIDLFSATGLVTARAAPTRGTLAPIPPMPATRSNLRRSGRSSILGAAYSRR